MIYLQQSPVPDEICLIPDFCRHAFTGLILEVRNRYFVHGASLEFLHHGICQRMFRTPFDLQQDGSITLVLRFPRPVNIRHDRFSLRDRSRFIQHDRVHPIHQLQALGIFDQYVMFRPFAYPDHDCRRRGQSQRTRASYNQHRDGGQQSMSESKVAPCQHPHDKRDHGNPHHHRDKNSGNTIHQFLHGSFTSLRFLHHPDNIGQHGFTSHLIGTETKTSLLVYRPGIHGLSLHLFHG